MELTRSRGWPGPEFGPSSEDFFFPLQTGGELHVTMCVLVRVTYIMGVHVLPGSVVVSHKQPHGTADRDMVSLTGKRNRRRDTHKVTLCSHRIQTS